MASYLTLLVVCLAACLSQAYSNVVPVDCNSKIPTCVGDMDDLKSVVESGNATVACGAFQEIIECLGSCLPAAIEQTGEIAPAVMKVYEFVCEPSRRSQINVLLGATCFRDGSLEARIGSGVQTCTREMDTKIAEEMRKVMLTGHMPNICPYVQWALDCLVDDVQYVCGAEVAPVFREIMKITGDEMLKATMRISCFDQVTMSHTLVKRAVADFFKFRK